MPGGLGSQQSGTTTTSNTPPAYMLPFLGTAANYATDILGNGGAQYYPGQTVAGFSKPQSQAFSKLSRLDNSILKGGADPMMSDQFKQEAEMTQPELQSEYAGSGSDLINSAPLRSDELNQLATGLYQTNLQNKYNAGSNLLGIGGQVQGEAQNLIDANKAKYNYYQNLPEQNLMQYIQALGGLPSGSQTSTPYYTNPTADFLGLGESGAGIYALLKSAGAFG